MVGIGYLDVERQLFGRESLDVRIHRLEIDPSALSLRAVEFGSGEPVLFLHGFGLCTAHWASLAARLPSVHGYAIDLPGHGESTGADLAAADLRRWSRDLLTGSLDRLGIGTAHVVGHSMGAIMALWLALDAPERVRSVITLGTPGAAFGADLKPLRPLATPRIGRLMLAMPWPTAIYRRIMAGSMGRHAVETEPDLLRATYLATRRADYATTVSSFLHELFTGAQADPPRYVLGDGELASLHQPALIIWGDHDTGFQSISDARSKAARIPNARFEVVPGGHEPWLDDREVVANLIEGFLRAA